VCESDVAYVRPGWAKNWKNEWVTVVNTEKYPQSIRIEICKYVKTVTFLTSRNNCLFIRNLKLSEK
jgi:hypothetical protein